MISDDDHPNDYNDQVAEEKANARESSYKEQIKTLTAKLKQEIITNRLW